MITKSNNHERLLQNLESHSFELSEKEISEIDALNRDLRVSVQLLLASRYVNFLMIVFNSSMTRGILTFDFPYSLK